MLILFYCFMVSGFIVMVSTIHLKWWKGRGAILLSSLLLGSLVTVMVLIWNGHHCEDGKPPGYFAFIGGVLAGAVPWCHSLSWNIRRLLAFCIAMLFVTLVGLLVSSYHSDGITGNPKLADGRFWHTSITGQYPRGSHVGQYEQALMMGLRERVHQLTHGGHEPVEEIEPQEDSSAE